ncbi:hypothetical protein MPER_11987 [Moniliophthora perniciosa FA553]|nr:hypothetical protein MPER_11987 [Moniliophthora perniciosa FA553]
MPKKNNNLKAQVKRRLGNGSAKSKGKSKTNSNDTDDGERGRKSWAQSKYLLILLKQEKMFYENRAPTTISPLANSRTPSVLSSLTTQCQVPASIIELAP